MNLHFLCFLSVILKASAFVGPTSQPLRQEICDATSLSLSNKDEMPFIIDEVSFQPSSRRVALANIMSLASSVPVLLLYPSNANAKLDPDTAYLNLRAAREELVVAGRKYFPKRDLEGLRDYLENEAVNMNNYEINAQALLESKRLDAESKKEIGTIRRYGVGADVIIMYGGLKSEISEDNDPINFKEAEKYYVRTLDALEEVIAICRSNKGFKQL